MSSRAGLVVLTIAAAFGTTSTAQESPAFVLKNLIAEGRSPNLRWPDFSNLIKDLRSFYEPSYELAWIRQGNATPQAEALTQILASAGSKGLSAEDYDGPRWAERITQMKAAGQGTTARDLAEFDLMLTVSAMRFLSDLHIGKANPGFYHVRLDLKDGENNLAGLVRKCRDAEDLPAWISSIEPPFPGYVRTRDALEHYLALEAKGDGELLTPTKSPVTPGSTYAGARILAERLRSLGDLPEDASVSGNLYRGALVDAVKRFQKRHGLAPDGRIGMPTFKELNTPLKQRVLQLELTLERYRWSPHHFERPPIVVNIPEFRLRVMNESFRPDLTMKVVVGDAYGHQTPVFTAAMKYIVFRPYWEVPPSIEHEIIPKAAGDSSYFARNGYEVVSSSGAVLGANATLEQLRSGAARMRQLPGRGNALGLVKFVFPNAYNVYMHGTPATRLFAKPRRDFSHGCIRLEAPEALAAFILRDKPGWTKEQIERAMHGSKTITVPIERAIPVLIVYATAVVQENGEVDFFDDIYGQDAELEKALERAYAGQRP